MHNKKYYSSNDNNMVKPSLSVSLGTMWLVLRLIGCSGKGRESSLFFPGKFWWLWRGEPIRYVAIVWRGDLDKNMDIHHICSLSNMLKYITIMLKYRTIMLKYRTITIKNRTIMLKYRTIALNCKTTKFKFCKFSKLWNKNWATNKKVMVKRSELLPGLSVKEQENIYTYWC